MRHLMSRWHTGVFCLLDARFNTSSYAKPETLLHFGGFPACELTSLQIKHNCPRIFLQNHALVPGNGATQSITPQSSGCTASEPQEQHTIFILAFLSQQNTQSMSINYTWKPLDKLVLFQSTHKTQTMVWTSSVHKRNATFLTRKSQIFFCWETVFGLMTNQYVNESQFHSSDLDLDREDPLTQILSWTPAKAT